MCWTVPNIEFVESFLYLVKGVDIFRLYTVRFLAGLIAITETWDYLIVVLFGSVGVFRDRT